MRPTNRWIGALFFCWPASFRLGSPRKKPTPLPEFTHPECACYIFGPEDGTVDQQIVDRADAVVYIPTVGRLNLAATVNVVLYDRLAKAAGVEVGDALIRRSRDRNNRVRVPALQGTPRRRGAK